MKNQCLRLFNKPLYAGLGLKQKTFSNCGATYQKKLRLLLFGNQGHFFHRANVQIGLTPLPQFVLVRFLRTLPCTTNVLFE